MGSLWGQLPVNQASTSYKSVTIQFQYSHKRKMKFAVDNPSDEPFSSILHSAVNGEFGQQPMLLHSHSFRLATFKDTGNWKVPIYKYLKKRSLVGLMIKFYHTRKAKVEFLSGMRLLGFAVLWWWLTIAFELVWDVRVGQTWRYLNFCFTVDSSMQETRRCSGHRQHPRCFLMIDSRIL